MRNILLRPSGRLKAIKLPKTPPVSLLESMAMRYNHEFWLLDYHKQTSILKTMTQLYQEVVDEGFYEWDSAYEKGTQHLTDQNKKAGFYRGFIAGVAFMVVTFTIVVILFSI